MSIKRIDTGPRMSSAVVYGNTVYLAGQVADKSAGQSVTDQTKEILGLVDTLLEKAGTNKSKILSATIYLADINTFTEMNSVWEGWVILGETPARATLEAKLAHPKYTVEIVIIAGI